MTGVYDWLGNHVSHTHTDPEIHTSTKKRVYKRTLYIFYVGINTYVHSVTHTHTDNVESASKRWGIFLKHK